LASDIGLWSASREIAKHRGGRKAVLTRSSIDPRLGIIVATILILAFGGLRLIVNWDEATLWRDPGLFATLFIGGLSGLALALGFLIHRRSEAITGDARNKPLIIELEAERGGERPEKRRYRRESA
jgi:hypothetical protein